MSTNHLSHITRHEEADAGYFLRYPTDEATDSILNSEYETLSNNEKGFKFEIEVQNVLDNLHLDYSGNPNIWNNWIKQQGSSEGYDIQLDFNNLKIECKFISVRPYHNSFLRDWYDRDCDVIVTSNKELVSIDDKELLESKGVILLSITELFAYLSKLLHSPTGVLIKLHTILDIIEGKGRRKAQRKARAKTFKNKFNSKITKLKTIMYEGYGRFNKQKITSILNTLVSLYSWGIRISDKNSDKITVDRTGHQTKLSKLQILSLKCIKEMEEDSDRFLSKHMGVHYTLVEKYNHIIPLRKLALMVAERYGENNVVDLKTVYRNWEKKKRMGLHRFTPSHRFMASFSRSLKSLERRGLLFRISDDISIEIITPDNNHSKALKQIFDKLPYYYKWQFETPKYVCPTCEVETVRDWRFNNVYVCKECNQAYKWVTKKRTTDIVLTEKGIEFLQVSLKLNPFLAKLYAEILEREKKEKIRKRREKLIEIVRARKPKRRISNE